MLEVIFIAANFIFWMGVYFISVYSEEIRNFLVGVYLDCLWKLIVGWLSFKAAYHLFKKHSKLTIEEEIELANSLEL